MKYLFCGLLLLSVSLSTKSQITQKEADNSIDGSYSKLKSVIQGVWITKNYIDAIEKTKSTFSSYRSLGGMISLYITTHHSRNNIIYVGYRTNNHEGGNNTLKFVFNDQANSLIAKTGKEKNPGFYELTYTIKNKDTMLLMSYHDLKTHFNINNLYIKVPYNSYANESDEIQVMVNRKLFSGNYIITDTKGNKNRIRLTDDGQITGHPIFKTYYVDTDYAMNEPGDGVDGISLYTENNYSRNGSDYIYEIKKDRINIHENKTDKDPANSKYGKLIYKLIKSK